MKKQEFSPKTVFLVGPLQRQSAHEALDKAPLGVDLEMVIRPKSKQRGLDANARMWAGPLKDIAAQAWVGEGRERRQYSAELWHEFYKQEYLPEEDDPDLDRLVKDPETYRKWDYDLRGQRVCVGSTTDLSRRGFAIYVEQIEAHGAGMGVRFSVNPREYQ